MDIHVTFGSASHFLATFDNHRSLPQPQQALVV
jgi:hypothetical protein